MFLVFERSSEAGPLRREGLAERDRDLRDDLESFARDALSSFLRESASGRGDSSMGLRLGDHLEVCADPRRDVVSASAVSWALVVSLEAELLVSERFWGAGLVLD